MSEPESVFDQSLEIHELYEEHEFYCEGRDEERMSLETEIVKRKAEMSSKPAKR